MDSKIRQARKSGDSVVITLSGFVEIGEYFLIDRNENTITLKKIELDNYEDNK